MVNHSVIVWKIEFDREKLQSNKDQVLDVLVSNHAVGRVKVLEGMFAECMSPSGVRFDISHYDSRIKLQTPRSSIYQHRKFFEEILPLLKILEAEVELEFQMEYTDLEKLRDYMIQHRLGNKLLQVTKRFDMKLPWSTKLLRIEAVLNHQNVCQFLDVLKEFLESYAREYAFELI